MNADRVCAVIVSPDGGDVAKSLAALAAQKRPAYAIVVVTSANVKDLASATVLAVESGTSRAAAFRAGFAWACERDFSWIWALDAELEVFPEALEVLVNYGSFSDFIQARTRTEGVEPVVEHVWNLSLADTVPFPREVSLENGREWIPVNYA